MRSSLVYAFVVSLVQFAASQHVHNTKDARDMTLDPIRGAMEGRAESMIPRAPKGGKGGGKGGGGGGTPPKTNNGGTPPKSNTPPPASSAPIPPKSSDPPSASSNVPTPSSRSSSSAIASSSSVQDPSSSTASSSASSISSSGIPSGSSSVIAPSSSNSVSAAGSSTAASGSVTSSVSGSVTSTGSITNAPPSTTLSSSTLSSTTSGEGDSCELDLSPAPGVSKRAPSTPKAKCQKPNSLTISEVTKSTAVLKTFTETCSFGYASQACAHYYSVIENNPKWKHFTCSDDNKRHDGYATQIWENQHPKNAWRDYLPKSMTNAGGIVSCQRDEYPPGFFMPADTLANQKNKNPQIIRWLPQEDNRRGGEIWTGFCTKKDGGKGNGQTKRKNKMDIINEDLVDLDQNYQEKKRKGNDGKTTTTRLYEAKYTRAVFEMAFDWNGKAKPDKGNDWYLSDNPCWPKAIASDDPGYNLMTDDNWYATAGSPAQQAARKVQKALYADDPPANYVSLAVKPNRRAIRGGLGGDLARRDFEILDDGFAVRRANMSRRLNDDEYEVFQCSTPDCAKERRFINEDEIAAVIPASLEKKDAFPVANIDVNPTAAPERRFVPADKRSDVSPELPTVTGSY